MRKQFVSNSKESVRMFTYAWMEALSQVQYTVPLYIFIPIILFLSWLAVLVEQLPLLSFAGYTLLGLFVWTLAEYVLHRFVFHYVPTAQWTLSGGALYAVFAAFLAWYLFCGISRYAPRHFTFGSRFWEKLNKHRMLLHHAHATKGCGVSSGFWDKIFDSDFDKK